MSRFNIGSQNNNFFLFFVKNKLVEIKGKTVFL